MVRTSSQRIGHAEPQSHTHSVRFYDSAADLTDALGQYLSRGLREGDAAVVIAVPEHRRMLEDWLTASGLDLGREFGRIIMLDAAETLALFDRGQSLDPDAFEAVIGDVLDRAAAHGRGVRAFGEIVALLWESGRVNAAIELESMWNRLAQGRDFTLLCGYETASVAGDDRLEWFQEVCRLHAEVVPPWPAADPLPAELSRLAEAEAVFPGSHDSPSRARRFVTGVLRDWSADDAVDDATLVVTELTTNAILHAGSDITVSLVDCGERIRVSVRDSSRVPPVPRPTPATDGNGRGLALVDGVARRWGARPVDGGKVVWAELHRSELRRYMQ